MGRLRRYFTTEGRATRLDYWRFQLMLAVVGAGLWIATVFATMLGGWLGAIPLLLTISVLVAGACMAVRRLHDRNKSAWWLAIFTFGPFAFFAPAHYIQKGASPLIVLAVALLALIGLGLDIWGWIEIGFRRGTRGDNRYGPPPVAR